MMRESSMHQMSNTSSALREWAAKAAQFQAEPKDHLGEYHCCPPRRKGTRLVPPLAPFVDRLPMPRRLGAVENV